MHRKRGEKRSATRIDQVRQTAEEAAWPATRSGRSTTGNAGSFSKIATTSATSYTNSGLTRGTTYWYYVVAYDNAGNKSNASNIASATAK